MEYFWPCKFDATAVMLTSVKIACKRTNCLRRTDENYYWKSGQIRLNFIEIASVDEKQIIYVCIVKATSNNTHWLSSGHSKMRGQGMLIIIFYHFFYLQCKHILSAHSVHFDDAAE